MKKYPKRWAIAVIVMLVLVMLQTSVFAEESLEKFVDNQINEELTLPTTNDYDSESKKSIEILSKEVAEDGTITTEAIVPLIQDGNIENVYKNEGINTSGLSQTVKEQIKADMLRAMSNLDASVSLSQYGIPYSEIQSLFVCYGEIVNDQPQMFYMKENSLVRSTKETVLEFCFYYEYSLDEIINMRSLYEQSVEEILSHVYGEMSIEEKVLAVHDTLCQSVEYDYDSLNSGNISKETHSAYGALVNGVSVCSGYSLGLLDLMGRIGIEAKYVTSPTMNHAWNLVKINNNWYHIDSTWDDQETEVLHIFFLKSDTYIGNLGDYSHMLDYSKAMPAAISTKYDTFLKRFGTMNYDEKLQQWIYMENGALYGSKINGDNKKLLVKAGSDSIKSFAVWKNLIFYQLASNDPEKKAKIYCSDNEGKKQAVFYELTLGQNASYSNLRVKDSRIFYDYNDPQIDNYYHHEARWINIFGKNDVPESVVTYRTHIQNIGWQEWKSQGGTSGTLGQNQRLEGIEIKLGNENADLNVEYSAHIQNIGWQAYKSNGIMSGTSGRGLQLEALKIRLTGTDANKFDVYYQVHAQNIGWLDWAKNDQKAGTAGFGYRLEAVRVIVLPKDLPAPGQTSLPFLQQ